MRILISFPGQIPRVMDAPPHIVEHYQKKQWLLPFIEVIAEPKTITQRSKEKQREPATEHP